MCFAWLNSAHASGKQNFLLILLDDLGHDVWNHSEVTMPTFRAMEQSGVRFNNMWTPPVCSPTRAALLTGRYGYRTGALGYKQRNPSMDEVLIPEALNMFPQLGYQSGAFGKWNLTSKNGGIVKSGFSYFAGTPDNVKNYYKWKYLVNKRLPDGKIKVEGPKEDKRYPTTVNVDDAIQWIKEQKEQPWFCYLPFNSIHDPVHLPPANLHTYDDRGYDLKKTRVKTMAMLEAIDTEVGRLMKSLSEKSRENTTILFMCDNGTTWGQCFPPYNPKRVKHSIYQGGIHVPAFISGAAVKKGGRVIDYPTNVTDFYATITELAGIKDLRSIIGANGLPVNFDSVSLVPYLNQTPQKSLREFVYCEKLDVKFRKYNGPIKTVRNVVGLKLIQMIQNFKKPVYVEELYDLSNDPLEKKNLFPLKPDDPWQKDLLDLRMDLEKRVSFKKWRAGAPKIIISDQTVKLIAAAPGDEIWYTTNGDLPAWHATHAKKYEAPFKLKKNSVLKARSYRKTTFPSFVMSGWPFENFVAYNDLHWLVPQPVERITTYSTREGNGKAIDEGYLRDFNSGTLLPARLKVTGGHYRMRSHTIGGGEPASGTDAHRVFTGKVSQLGSITADKKNGILMEFSHLNPHQKYEIVLFGNQNQSGKGKDDKTSISIHLAREFKNKSSSGVQIENATAPSATVINGQNGKKGLIVRFTDIVPSEKGEVHIRAIGNDVAYLNSIAIGSGQSLLAEPVISGIH